MGRYFEPCSVTQLPISIKMVFGALASWIVFLWPFSRKAALKAIEPEPENGMKEETVGESETRECIISERLRVREVVQGVYEITENFLTWRPGTVIRLNDRATLYFLNEFTKTWYTTTLYGSHSRFTTVFDSSTIAINTKREVGAKWGTVFKIDFIEEQDGWEEAGPAIAADIRRLTGKGLQH